MDVGALIILIIESDSYACGGGGCVFHMLLWFLLRSRSEVLDSVRILWYIVHDSGLLPLHLLPLAGWF